jgi:hypothetical protein
VLVGASGETYMLELQNIRRMRGGETLWPEVGKLPPVQRFGSGAESKRRAFGILVTDRLIDLIRRHGSPPWPGAQPGQAPGVSNSRW